MSESRGGRPGLLVPNSPYGLCGRKATLNCQELCESRGGHPGLLVPNSPYGLCGRNARVEDEKDHAKRLCAAHDGAKYRCLKLFYGVRL